MEKDQLSRKQAVILHADVVGSTVLVQKNETLAHSRIQEVFKTLSNTISNYAGNTREIRGDAVVAEFERASDAVAAALSFQALNNKSNFNIDDDINPKLRIGISMGEVIIADNTITGPGVVIAQRLEQLAEASGVVVQGSVSETVPDRLPFQFESLGEQVLKGFENPIRAFAVCLRQGREIPQPEAKEISTNAEHGAQLNLPDLPSIAVLPLNNMSGDPDQEYFSDGISEDLITDLSHFSRLFVIARNSSFKYRGDSVDIRQVGSELGVHYVLEGSVRKSGDRVRISVQLIDSLSGAHVWANRFDRVLDDVFEVQDEIVSQIVAAVAGKVDLVEFARRKRKPTSSLTAYDYYLRGCQYASYRSKVGDVFDSCLRAKDYLEKAVSLDPEFAEALADLADVYMYLSELSPAHPDYWEKAEKYAELALRADSENARANSVFGFCPLESGDFNKAEYHFKKALRLNPNDTLNISEYCQFLGYMGKTDEAVAKLESALRRDPFHSELLFDTLGGIYWIGGRYQEAISAYEKLTSIPYWVHGHMAACYASLGQIEESKVHAQAYMEMLPEGYSAEEEIGWYQDIIRDESARKSLVEGFRKAGLID
jgi:adenylate cyclase